VVDRSGPATVAMATNEEGTAITVASSFVASTSRALIFVFKAVSVLGYPGHSSLLLGGKSGVAARARRGDSQRPGPADSAGPAKGLSCRFSESRENYAE